MKPFYTLLCNVSPLRTHQIIVGPPGHKLCPHMSFWTSIWEVVCHSDSAFQAQIGCKASDASWPR